MADARWNYDPGPDPKAVAFLEAKGLRRSWRWASMWGNEHAYAFTLAGVYRLDVIAAAQELAVKAVREGETYEEFRSQFRARLKALGFEGPQTVTEFEEGPRDVNLTAPWRMRVIYDTNVRNAYAAAEWQAIVDTAADLPALEYAGVDDEVTRASHRRWFGIVLPVTHVFWTIYFPPNDWFCRCYTIQVSLAELASGAVKLTTEDELARRGFSADPTTWPEWRHQATGRVERVPIGVGPGFAHNAGMARRASLGELLARKVEAMDPDIARAAAADLVNLPVFRDLVDDAVALGVARALARSAAAKRLRGRLSPGPEIAREAAAAADRAGRFPPDSWPVGVAPAALDEADLARLVVTNAQAIGHSADVHATRPEDWRRVQLMLERGEAYVDAAGELTIFAEFQGADGRPQTWLLALKPVGGVLRLRTLFPTSPRRRARITAGRRRVRAGTGLIRFE